jgi:hypothetical protein
MAVLPSLSGLGSGFLHFTPQHSTKLGISSKNSSKAHWMPVNTGFYRWREMEQVCGKTPHIVATMELDPTCAPPGTQKKTGPKAGL